MRPADVVKAATSASRSHHFPNGRPRTHTHIYTNTFYWQCTKAYTENKLNNTPHIPIITEPLHSLTDHISGQMLTDTLYIPTAPVHARKHIQCLFLAFYRGIFYSFNGVLQGQGHIHVAVTYSHFN